jgi:peptidoglycan-associated lipoprotein
MGSKRLLALLIVLSLAAGCRATTKTAPELAAAAVESSSPSTARVAPPDADALSPASAPPPPREFVPAARLVDIHFDFDVQDIRPEDTPILDANAIWLKANPNTLLLVEGHTDERGTSEYNLRLGDLRAAAVLSYLLAQGVPAARMVAISYGKEQPVCTERTEACWARN